MQSTHVRPPELALKLHLAPTQSISVIESRQAWLPTSHLESGPLTDWVTGRLGWPRATKELRCLLAGLVAASRAAAGEGRPIQLIVRRDRRRWVKQVPARYRKRMWEPSYARLMTAVDALERDDLLVVWRGDRDARRATAIEARGDLLDTANELGVAIEPASRPDFVLLKGPHEAGGRQLVNYRDDAEAMRLQKNLDAINKHLGRFTYTYLPSQEETDTEEGGEAEEERTERNARGRDALYIRLPAVRRVSSASLITLHKLVSGYSSDSAVDVRTELHPSQLAYRRIFHVERPEDGPRWDSHGRFYSWFQSRTGDERRTLRIDGEETVELDISGMHPTLMYHARGLPAPADPYAVPGLDPAHRAHYKLATLIIFNAASRDAAHRALSHHLRGPNGRWPAGVYPDEVLDAMEAAHAPIRDSFYSATSGAWAMNRDSQIAERVMLTFVGSDIPCIGIHDGFVVPAHAEDRLHRAMVDAYRAVMGRQWTPTIKATYADGSKRIITSAYRETRTFANVAGI